MCLHGDLANTDHCRHSPSLACSQILKEVPRWYIDYFRSHRMIASDDGTPIATTFAISPRIACIYIGGDDLPAMTPHVMSPTIDAKF